jgi:hypothetical protein
MHPNGYLLMGGAETTIGIDDSFRRLVCGRTVIYGHPKGTSTPA